MRNNIDFEATSVNRWDANKGMVTFYTVDGEEICEEQLSELISFVEDNKMDYREKYIGNSSYDGNPAFDEEWCGSIGGMEFLQESDESFVKAVEAFYRDVVLPRPGLEKEDTMQLNYIEYRLKCLSIAEGLALSDTNIKNFDENLSMITYCVTARAELLKVKQSLLQEGSQ